MAPTTSDAAAPKTADLALPPPTVNPRMAAAAFAFTKAIADRAGSLLGAMRANADLAFEPGEDYRVKHPADRRVDLALVSTTNPAADAVVVDEAGFRDWFLENHDERCEDVDLPLPGVTTGRLIAALREHAPQDVIDQLVTADRVVPDHERNAVLKRSAKAGQPIGPNGEIGEKAPPGIEIREKKSVVQVRLADGAVEQVMALWQSGLVDPFALPAGWDVDEPPAPAAEF